MTDFDGARVLGWLRLLHGDAPGLVNIVATDNWAGQVFATDQLERAADYVGVQHRAGRAGIYARVTTLREAPTPDPTTGKRGRSGADNSMALPALWADLDLAGPGHEHEVCALPPICTKQHTHRSLPLPPDVEAGQKIITMSGLPEPTIWVHSGGGLYPVWLLERPHVITDDHPDVKRLASGWQVILEHAAAQLGWFYARGVGDLARVLRIPGTINRKPEMAEPAPCRILSASPTRYPLEALYEALAAGLARIPQPTPPAPAARADAAPAPTRSSINLEPGDLTPADDWAARTDWADILTPHGWTLSHAEEATRFWTRPGKTTGISATTNHEGTDRLYVFTTSTSFDANDSYSKLGALAILEYNGDHSAAVKALRAKNFGSPLPDPAQLQREMLRDLLGTVPPAPTKSAPLNMLGDWTPQPTPDSRPKLNVGNAANMADWLRDTLGTGPLAGMFLRGDQIVHAPREGEDGYLPLSDRDTDTDGAAQVRSASPDYIAAQVQYSHTCYRNMVNRNGDLVMDPATGQPKEIKAMFPTAASRTAVNAVNMMGHLRRLRGVIHAPVFREDGSLVEAPGYDPATRLLYLPEAGLTIPPVTDQPTTAEVRAAVALLGEMIADFPFVSEHHRANYLGMLITPLLRTLARPPYKLAAIEAHQPASGKTLLANLVRLIHGGVFRSEMPEDDAELRKQVTAILSITTGPLVVLDNVSGALKSSTLAGLLTSDQWDDRPLGSTSWTRCINDRLWMITGNNLNIGGDLPRRTLRTVIDPGRPQPELRTGFRITNLEGWVTARRGHLLHALLTLVRAWVVTGRPLPAAHSSDGYARWIDTVAGILAVAGIPGTFDHSSTQIISGEEDDDWRDFLLAIRGVMGDCAWTVKELLGHINTGLLITGGAIPMDLLPGNLAEKATKVNGLLGVGKSLGRWFMNREGRWAGPVTVRSTGEDRSHVKQWRIESIPDRTVT